MKRTIDTSKNFLFMLVKKEIWLSELIARPRSPNRTVLVELF